MNRLIRSDIYNIARNMEYMNADGSKFHLRDVNVEDHQERTVIYSEGDLLEIEQYLSETFKRMDEDSGLIVQVLVEANRKLGLGFVKYFPVSTLMREMDRMMLPAPLKAAYLDMIAEYYLSRVGVDSSYALRASAKVTPAFMKPFKHMDLTEAELIRLTALIERTLFDVRERRHLPTRANTYVSLVKYTEFDLVTDITEKLAEVSATKRRYNRTVNIDDSQLEVIVEDIYENSKDYMMRQVIGRILEIYSRYPIHTPKYAEEVEDYYLYRDVSSVDRMYRKLLSGSYA